MTSFAGPDFTSEQWDWLAIRYLLDELKDHESVEFEQHLAESQDAREALARSTILIQSLGHTPIPATSVRPVNVSTRRRWFIAAAACAALVLVGVFSFNGVQPSRPVVVELPAQSGAEPDRLAALWIDSSDSLNNVAESSAGDDAVGTESQSALLPPDWLLAAVEYEAVASSAAGEPFGGDEDDIIERN